MTGTPAASWTDAPLVALDLEGTGAQDRENEAILEISIVPLNGGLPSLNDAYTTLINPGRPIPRRPWISPGLTDTVLADAPTLTDVAPEVTARLAGKVIVGHNIGVDWRLLRRCCPDTRPDALIDTLRLARYLNPEEKGNGLTTLLNRYRLTETVTSLAPDGQPHRALWDTIGAALLLATLTAEFHSDTELTFAELHRIAGHPIEGNHRPVAQTSSEQISLLDL